MDVLFKHDLKENKKGYILKEYTSYYLQQKKN